MAAGFGPTAADFGPTVKDFGTHFTLRYAGAFDRGGSHLIWHLGVFFAVLSFEQGVRRGLLHQEEIACAELVDAG